MEYISKGLDDTQKIAGDFANSLKPKMEGATVVGLYGELGSGKTTFMKYLAESFGVGETVQSPTFVIMKIYELVASSKQIVARFKHLIHIDAYRIEKEEEMVMLGWREIISDPKNLICVEWPERVAGIMPEHTKIIFHHIDESSRKIILEL